MEDLIKKLKHDSFRFIMFLVLILVVYFLVVVFFGLNNRNFEIRNDGFYYETDNVNQVELTLKRMV